jgi:uncharacterized protein YjbI with pentapeptide repeats
LLQEIAFGRKAPNSVNIWEILENLEREIESCHTSSTIYNRVDFPTQWAENQSTLSNLQQLILAEIERERLIITRSPRYQAISNSQVIDRDLRFQERKFFDFRGVGIPDCSTFEFADLSGANLRRTRTNRTRMSYIQLIDADLSDVRWINIKLVGANLSNANLQGAKLYYELSTANFSNANLCNANLSANLMGANFSNANLCDANLENANLDGANFNNANVTNTKFGKNTGIYPSLKQDLIDRGAIFDES